MDELSSFASWLESLCGAFADWIWAQLTSAVVAVFQALPSLPFLGSINALFTQIDPGMLWFMNFVQLPTGLGFVISAYIFRFVLRRIPFIGG